MTGGGSGIGREFCFQLSENGCRVTVSRTAGIFISNVSTDSNVEEHFRLLELDMVVS